MCPSVIRNQRKNINHTLLSKLAPQKVKLKDKLLNYRLVAI